MGVLDGIRALYPDGTVLVVRTGAAAGGARELSIEHGPIGNCAVFAPATELLASP